jgi:tetratricopeptide (TPR) repeat protein
MPPDHIATLRSAEKLLRVGKIAAAIVEYTKAVTQAPHEWDTAILLASLHARNNDVNTAVTQYREIATGLTGERMHARAAHVLEKVLALRPGDEDTLEQLAGASAANGDIAAACSHLMRIAERRLSRGEFPRAIDALEKAATLDPAGSGAAGKLFDLCIQSGDLARARKYTASARDCRTLATAMRQAGQAADARDLLRNAHRLDPSDLSSAATLAADYLREGDIEHAAEFLSPAVIGNDPATRGATIDLFLHAGRGDAAMQMAASLAAESSDGIDRIAELACSLANESPDTAYALAELALTPWIEGHAWDSAIAALELFTAAAPDYSPALIRLVEAAVDAERLDIADRAQEMLAAAYLAKGEVAEALHIAQDLHERDPRNPRYDALLQRARQTSRHSPAHDDAVIVPMRAAR